MMSGVTLSQICLQARMAIRTEKTTLVTVYLGNSKSSFLISATWSKYLISCFTNLGQWMGLKVRSRTSQKNKNLMLTTSLTWQVACKISETTQTWTSQISLKWTKKKSMKKIGDSSTKMQWPMKAWPTGPWRERQWRQTSESNSASKTTMSPSWCEFEASCLLSTSLKRLWLCILGQS